MPAMYAHSPEARRELVLRVFPELRFGGDQDLERYFELRKAGRLGEALSLYNGPLRARYPDDGSRILLLRLFREHDPRWQKLQTRLLDALGKRLAARVAANIDALVEPLSSASLRTAFGALGAVESLLGRLRGAGGAEGALELLERYLGFARVLGYRVSEIERARDLLRDYLALAAAETPDEQDFVARSKALEERKRAAAPRAGEPDGRHREGRVDFIARSEAIEMEKREAKRRHSRYFDLSRLSFTAAERARIELNPLPERHEDLVLAYCLKFWKPALDPGFERLVFLYSRKYGSLHHELYKAIRIGRLRKRSDDEILAAVSSLLSVRYSYSVMGDLYMQSAWRRLKAGIESAAPPSAGAATVAIPIRQPSPPSPPSPPRPAAEPPLRSAAIGPRREKPRPSREPSPMAAAPAPEKARLRLKPHKLAPGREERQLAPAAPPPEPLLAIKPRGGSISDRIRRLSGKNYDVYKSIFLERVRDDIHRRLLGSRTKRAGLFDTSANEAEDIVYGFMAAHYEDPFMDWEGSGERALVEELGYALPSLDPIIEACHRRL